MSRPVRASQRVVLLGGLIGNPSVSSKEDDPSNLTLASAHGVTTMKLSGCSMKSEFFHASYFMIGCEFCLGHVI